MAKRVKQPRAWSTAALRDLPVGGRYLVGVSGGRDSVALLHWLLSLGYRKLVVCHLDHGLRGRESLADARFVEKLATRSDLLFESKAEDMRSCATKHRISIETAARAARYEFFAEVSRRRRCSTIFLGHHADDLVETFLFNLLRGSGNEGLRSIRPISARPVKGAELTIVRPLLGVWREEIDAYVEANGLTFREDASNRSLEPKRNRIRHRIIPLIEKEFGRAVRKSLWRAAEIVAEEHAVLEQVMPEDLQQEGRLRVAVLRKLPVALQRRAIRCWLRGHGIAEIGFDLIESARALLDLNSPRAKINLPGNRYVRRRAGELFVDEPRS